MGLAATSDDHVERTRIDIVESLGMVAGTSMPSSSSRGGSMPSTMLARHAHRIEVGRWP